ncbi:MAG: ComEC/Rec2 family competence protein, partial [Campylobacterales bacterium]
WVYIMMLSYSLVIFGNFSMYHPLSVFWTLLFSLFYPLSIFLHLIGLGTLLDRFLVEFISLDSSIVMIYLNTIFLYICIFLSFLALYKRYFIYILLFYNLGILTYATIHL